MPEKSIREMGLFEKQHHSIEARTFRATIVGAIVFGLAAMLLGMGMYTYAVAKRYISDAYNLTRHARVVLENVVDPAGLANEIMDRYYALPEEVRSDPESEAYKAVFADIEEREDYQQIISVFSSLLSAQSSISGLSHRSLPLSRCSMSAAGHSEKQSAQNSARALPMHRKQSAPTCRSVS